LTLERIGDFFPGSIPIENRVSKQRNRRNRKLARKKKSDPHQAKSRLRKMRRTRIRGK
jgi:hypothetical protein